MKKHIYRSFLPSRCPDLFAKSDKHPNITIVTTGYEADDEIPESEMTPTTPTLHEDGWYDIRVDVPIIDFETACLVISEIIGCSPDDIEIVQMGETVEN